MRNLRFILALLAVLLLPLAALAQNDTDIAIGDTVEGALTRQNLSAQYTLSGNQGDTVTITLESSAFDGFLTLLAPDDQELASDDDSAGGSNPSIIDFLLPQSGDYTIVVDSYNRLATGDYTLSVTGTVAVATSTPRPTSTPTAPPPTLVGSEGTELAFGDTVEGTLSTSDSAIAYTFSGSSGQSVTITLTSSDFDSYVVLTDADGEILVADDDGAGNLNSRIQDFVLPATGDYTIQAGSYGSGAQGSFTLTLEGEAGTIASTPSATLAATAVATTVVIQSSDGTIRVGESASGTLTERTALYTLQGETGLTVTIRLESTDFDSYLVLKDEAGDTLIEDDDGAGNSNAQISNFRLAGNTTYTIVVGSFGGLGTGDYTLTVSAGTGGDATPEPTPNPEATVVSAGAGTISLGETVNGSLSETTATYTFDADEGQAVTITLTSNAFDPYLTLTDADGTVLDMDDDGAGNLNAQIRDFTFPADGTYSITVSGASGRGTGAFALTLEAGTVVEPTATPTAEPTASTFSPPGTIGYGETVTSTLSDGPNAHTFEGQAGDVVTITLVSNQFDAYLRLLDASGSELTTDDDSAGDLNARIQNFRLPVNGTYTILASGFDDTATGDYTLSLSQGDEPLPPTQEPTGEPTIVPVGNEIAIGDTAAGTLQGDLVTTYTFQGESGQIVNITLTSDTFDTFLRLIGPDGFELITDDDSAGNLDSRISLYELPANGLYTISVESFNSVSGDYLLTLTAATINLIEYTQDVSGSLEAGVTTMGYRFTGQAGDVITISLSSDDFDTFLSLREVNGDGLALIENDDGGNGTDSLIGPYTLPATGDYIVIVRSFDSASEGDYHLQIERVILTPIEFDDPVTVSFDGETGAQYFSFEAVTGDVINITVDSGSSVDTSLTLNGPDSYQIISDDDSGRNFDPEVSHLILSQDGIYTLVLQPFTVGDVGEVTLTLARGIVPSLDAGSQTVRLSEKIPSDVVTFTGVAGEKVRLTFDLLSGGNIAPNIVVNQDGVAVATASGSSTSSLSLEFTVPADGLLTVQISDYNYSQAVLEVSLEHLE